MKSVFILMLIFYFSIACVARGKMPDRSGVYIKDIPGVGKLEFKLNRLSDTVYYFEYTLKLAYKSDSLVDGMGELGILKLKLDTLVYVNSGVVYHFKVFFPDDADLVIDSVDFKMPTNVSWLSGVFSRSYSGKLVRPDFQKEFQTSIRWEEGIATSDSSVKLFLYPYNGSDSVDVRVKKKTVVNSYIDIPSEFGNKKVFYYVIWRDGDEVVAGWMESYVFFKIIKRIYKSERYEDGSVVKWNKEQGYSLYFDSSGRLLRRENANDY